MIWRQTERCRFWSRGLTGYVLIRSFRQATPPLALIPAAAAFATSSRSLRMPKVSLPTSPPRSMIGTATKIWSFVTPWSLAISPAHGSVGAPLVVVVPLGRLATPGVVEGVVCGRPSFQRSLADRDLCGHGRGGDLRKGSRRSTSASSSTGTSAHRTRRAREPQRWLRRPVPRSGPRRSQRRNCRNGVTSVLRWSW